MMNGYFKPLRRKIGVMTLAMACLLMCGWGRSQISRDRISFPNEPKYRFLMELGEEGLVVVFNGVNGRGELRQLVGWVIPWFVTIPLTVLSAWLLLSRPRAPEPIRLFQTAAAKDRRADTGYGVLVRGWMGQKPDRSG